MDASQPDVIAPVPATIARGIVYLTAVILVAVLAVLYFGRVPVIVSAKGRIVPEGDVVLLQSIQAGVVSAVLAKAGDRLPAGAPVVKLDGTDPALGLSALQERQKAQREERDRLQATIALVDRILADPDQALEGTRKTVIATVGKVAELVNQLEDLKGRVDGAKGSVAGWPGRKTSMQREVDLTRENVRVNEASYASQARLLESTDAALAQRRTQLDGFRRLNERQLLSALELAAEEERFRSAEAAAAEARRRVGQLEIDISNQKIRLSEIEARFESEPFIRQGAVRQAENVFRQSLALLRQEGENLRTRARDVESGLENTAMLLSMAKNQISLTSVSMPVAGLVAEMKVSAPGELLTAGQLVATIVPDGVPLVVEVAVPNNDIGFVRAGVEGRIKVDAYPFQQFGTLPARVRAVLPGLGRDNNFTVRLDLMATTVGAADSRLAVFPGLTVEAELLTARQRLIDLVLASSATRGR